MAINRQVKSHAYNLPLTSNLKKAAMNAQYRKDYQPSDYEILTTALTFDIHEGHTEVTNKMHIRRNTAAKINAPLILNGEDQELRSLQLNTHPLSPKDYKQSKTDLRLDQLPEDFTLTVVSRIHPELNTKLEGLYQSKGMFCTQCEPHGFRRITFYLDRPDVLSFFTTQIIADSQLYPVLLSNGNLIDSGKIGENRHYATWEDPFKKPCYLFALVAGNLEKISDTFITQSGRSVNLEIFSDATSISQCHYAMQCLKEAMRWDEVRFGREYDLNTYMIVATQDFNMGAMENKGLNIFNTKYVLAHPSLSTDLDYQNIQAVIGHEYFHNWTGNRVTCRDWFQLSLKEGLTVFRDAEFTADHHDRTLKRILDANLIRSSQFAEDASPMAHPIRPDSYVEMNNFYTTTVYQKGAEVIRMMHTLLGEEGFRKGMDLYFQRHDGTAVTCDDFVAAMADANQFDFSLFKNWYSQAGTPEVWASGHYDEMAHTFTLHFKQNRLFHIPIKLGLISQSGHVLNYQEGPETIYSLKEKEAQLVLHNVMERPIPSLLRDFSAPIKLFYDYTLDDLAVLWQYDSNHYNRWDAGQRFMSSIILALYRDDLTKLAPLESKILPIITHFLKNAALYPGLTSELITLPSIKSLAELIPPPLDPAKLIQARESIFTLIYQNLKSAFARTYQEAQAAEQAHPQNAAQYRMLKNVCLQYLCAAGEHQEALLQYEKAENMTDCFAALTAIVNAPQYPKKQALLDHFYQKYQSHPLVVDKWLAVQANSKLPDTLNQVRHLMQHPAFLRQNPNKIYALLNTFGQNFYAFHDQKGEGYRLLGDFIAELNTVNPLVSARLTRILMNFKLYSEPYSSLMRKVLETLQARKDLSSDVAEIVNKALK